jgi:hypothetical protein
MDHEPFMTALALSSEQIESSLIARGMGVASLQDYRVRVQKGEVHVSV